MPLQDAAYSTCSTCCSQISPQPSLRRGRCYRSRYTLYSHIRHCQWHKQWHCWQRLQPTSHHAKSCHYSQSKGQTSFTQTITTLRCSTAHHTKTHQSHHAVGHGNNAEVALVAAAPPISSSTVVAAAGSPAAALAMAWHTGLCCFQCRFMQALLQ